MCTNAIVLGIDLGSSGVRVAGINTRLELIHHDAINYQKGLEYPEDWEYCCEELIKNIPLPIRKRIVACAVDGTSGTLMACNHHGISLGKAMPYFLECPEKEEMIANLITRNQASSTNTSSIARALNLVQKYGNDLLLRHQADWITGWLMNNWTWGEEGNNLKMGWDAEAQKWCISLSRIKWDMALPKILPSGTVIGYIDRQKAKLLGLPKNIQMISGTTDSNAAVLATNERQEVGITVLGSTIVLKSYSDQPIKGLGITNHKIGERWLVGGASNAGGAVLRKFFTDEELRRLSKQINPDSDTGIKLLPLPYKGERFPVNDPDLLPILEPRPISDSLYLHALFEGLSEIEAQGWKKLNALGINFPSSITSIGGGARNQQWRKIRERILGIPIKSCNKSSAFGVAILGMEAMTRNNRL